MSFGNWYPNGFRSEWGRPGATGPGPWEFGLNFLFFFENFVRKISKKTTPWPGEKTAGKLLKRKIC